MTVLALSVLSGCTLAPDEEPAPETGAGPIRAEIEGPGTGSFMFTQAKDITGHEVEVFYIAPDGDLADAEILMVIHGNERDAEDYREDWEPLVEDHNVLVLLPEFPDEEFSDTEYNLGGMVTERGEERPTDNWTFTVIESLFSHVTSSLGSRTDSYGMFGHSAGGQFVHRYVEFAEHPHLATAVAANAGWYTVPDNDEPFPYGLEDHQFDVDDLESAFNTDLLILLGADDIDPESDALRHDEGSDKQGSHRLERGLYFFLKSREAAEDHDMSFRWRLAVVPGIGHDHTAMAVAAAPYLLPAGADPSAETSAEPSPTELSPTDEATPSD